MACFGYRLHESGATRPCSTENSKLGAVSRPSEVLSPHVGICPVCMGSSTRERNRRPAHTKPYLQSLPPRRMTNTYIPNPIEPQMKTIFEGDCIDSVFDNLPPYDYFGDALVRIDRFTFAWVQWNDWPDGPTEMATTFGVHTPAFRAYSQAIATSFDDGIDYDSARYAVATIHPSIEEEIAPCVSNIYDGSECAFSQAVHELASRIQQAWRARRVRESKSVPVIEYWWSTQPPFRRVHTEPIPPGA